MHNLICMLLSEADLLLESDPVSDILKLWKDHGIQSVMVLDRVSINQMSQIYTELLTIPALPSNSVNDHSVLFDVPEQGIQEEEPHSTHRMLLAITNKSGPMTEKLLDATEALTNKMVNGNQNLIFVMPLLHVRGFPSPTQ